MQFRMLGAFLLALVGTWVLVPWTTYLPTLVVASEPVMGLTAPAPRRRRRLNQRRAPDSPDH